MCEYVSCLVFHSVFFVCVFCVSTILPEWFRIVFIHLWVCRDVSLFAVESPGLSAECLSDAKISRYQIMNENQKELYCQVRFHTQGTYCGALAQIYKLQKGSKPTQEGAYFLTFFNLFLLQFLCVWALRRAHKSTDHQSLASRGTLGRLARGQRIPLRLRGRQKFFCKLINWVN